MDILYYSNQCKHCKKILQVLSKTQIKEKVSFICIDNRATDKQTNQTFILLNNGSKVIMPPNLASVPALLNVKENYRMIFGDKIIACTLPLLSSKSSNIGKLKAAVLPVPVCANAFKSSVDEII